MKWPTRSFDFHEESSAYERMVPTATGQLLSYPVRGGAALCGADGRRLGTTGLHTESERDAAWPGEASRDLVGKVRDTGREPQKDLGPLGLILDILKLINMD